MHTMGFIFIWCNKNTLFKIYFRWIFDDRMDRGNTIKFQIFKRKTFLFFVIEHNWICRRSILIFKWVKCIKITIKISSTCTCPIGKHRIRNKLTSWICVVADTLIHRRKHFHFLHLFQDMFHYFLYFFPKFKLCCDAYSCCWEYRMPNATLTYIHRFNACGFGSVNISTHTHVSDN